MPLNIFEDRYIQLVDDCMKGERLFGMIQPKIKIGSNRSFGVVFFIVFLLISVYPLINDENIRYWSLLISLIIFTLPAVS